MHERKQSGILWKMMGGLLLAWMAYVAAAAVVNAVDLSIEAVNPMAQLLIVGLFLVWVLIATVITLVAAVACHRAETQPASASAETAVRETPATRTATSKPQVPAVPSGRPVGAAR
jgi:hypothetical protein